MTNRQIKILFGVCIGLYMALVCFNNITDHVSNFRFVRMVAGMDDVFSKESTGWRAVKNDTLHHIMYLFIIACELTITCMVVTGTYKMMKQLKSEAAEFHRAKKWLRTGLALGVVLWFGMFISIGGEWFLMWQSKEWNGQFTAFFLTICFLLFLIYLDTGEERPIST